MGFSDTFNKYNPIGLLQKAPAPSGGGAAPSGGGKPSMPGGGGGSKPSMPGGGGGGYDYTFGLPLTKETDTTYGGTKPGKAPTQKAPPAPDPFKLIEEQGKQNRINEVGPSGSTIYSKDPGTGIWTANRSFSPQLQGLYNKQLGLLDDPSFSDEGVTNAVFQQQKNLLDPVFNQQRRDTEQRLANQGLPMGSEAYNEDLNRLDRAQNQAYDQASLGAVTTGRNFGLQQRNSTFNQLAALLGGQQVNPTAPIDVTGPFNSQYQGQLNSVNAANANAAQRNAGMQQGGVALASMLAMLLCSKKYKENNTKIDDQETLDRLEKLQVEEWNYKGSQEKHIGPYAEDFQAIFGKGDGEMIPVIDAIGVCLSAIKALTKRVRELEDASTIIH